jgi:branched-subunit amino acid aminotransferase/4-amino-4-deoxychorismate lyase
MANQFVICDHGLVEANLVPDECLTTPGHSPYGVYDTVLVYRGRLVDFDLHWERFQAAWGLYNDLEPWNLSVEEVQQLIAANDVIHGRLRLMAFANAQQLTDGRSFRYLAGIWPVKITNGLIGIRCKIADTCRQYGDVPYAIKLLGRDKTEQELEAARASGYDDVIFQNSKGDICEASFSNIVVVKDDAVYISPVETPRLNGITVSELMKNVSRPVKYEAVSADQVLSQDSHQTPIREIFLTSSIRGVQWVKELGTFRAADVAPDNSVCAELYRIFKSRREGT